jgi:hypothetical protein
MNGRPMQQYCMGEKTPIRMAMDEKLKAIEAQKNGNLVYFESSHCFIKGFGWEIPNHISVKEIGVIILSRGAEEVAESYQRIGCTQYTFKGRKWLMPFELYQREQRVSQFTHIFNVIAYSGFRLARKLRLIKDERVLLPGFVKRSERAFLKWYVAKTSELTKNYQLAFPQIRFFALDFKDINNPEAIARMLSTFGMSEYMPLVLESGVIGTKANTKRLG